jgi:hypothetical protein
VWTDRIDVTTLGVIGDGKTDNAKSLQAALSLASGQGKALYFPYGLYLLSDTVEVPPGTRMEGEAWSTLMAAGESFQDPKAPRPMLRVGRPGDRGGVQMAGLLLSTVGPQPGAVLVEWNMKDPEGEPGACGMWEVHFRVGGAIHTQINQGDCMSSLFRFLSSLLLPLV